MPGLGCVVVVPVVDRTRGRSADVLGCGKIGLADREIDDVDAVGGHPLGGGGDGHGGGDSDLGDSVREHVTS